MVDFKTHLKPRPATEVAATMARDAIMRLDHEPMDKTPEEDIALLIPVLEETLVLDRKQVVNFYRSRLAQLFKVLGADAGECKSCGAQIWWLRMPKSGKPAPFDKDGLNHFGSCKHAEEHRKP